MENDFTHPPSVRQLSDLQEKVLAILPLPSALLSVVGSSIILFIALESRKRNHWTPYTRLLVALSLTDILYSISISISSFLRPKDSSNFVFAMGNDASCNVSGFLNQLGVSAFFYNAALSYYFLATARYGVSANQFSRRMEKYVHLISLGHPILTASIGLYLDLYAENRGIQGCWLEFDKRCMSEDPEVKALANNCTLRYTSFAFYIIPALFTSFSLIVNNLVISRFVKTKVMKLPRDGRLASLKTSRSDGSTSSDGKIVSTSANTMKTEAVLVAPKRSPSNDLEETQKAQFRRLKLVRSQAFLFVASFALCHIWSVAMATGIFRAKSKTDELEFLVKYYPVAILQAIFQPLQGLLNMLVFVRPKCLRWRREYPRETRLWALQRSIFGERIRPKNVSIKEREKEEPLEHLFVEKKDKGDSDFVIDGSRASSAYSRPRENISDLTASLGDFDHVIEDGVEDERWTSAKSDGLTSWKPPTMRPRQFTSSGTMMGLNLEVISEDAESVFEDFPSATSMNNSVASDKKKQQELPLESSICPEQREGRWNSSESDACSSPMERTRPTDGVLAFRFQSSLDTDMVLETNSPHSPVSRWSSEGSKLQDVTKIATIARREESLIDESSSSTRRNFPKSMASLSTPFAYSSGDSVSSCASSVASVDSPLVPPRRRLSPPPFGNEPQDYTSREPSEQER